jgi:hypothetical protein
MSYVVVARRVAQDEHKDEIEAILREFAPQCRREPCCHTFRATGLSVLSGGEVICAPSSIGQIRRRLRRPRPHTGPTTRSALCFSSHAGG